MSSQGPVLFLRLVGSSASNQRVPWTFDGALTSENSVIVVPQSLHEVRAPKTPLLECNAMLPSDFVSRRSHASITQQIRGPTDIDL